LVSQANGVTDITISATDSDLNSVASQFTLTVTPVNDAPVITSGANFLTNENTTAVATITSTDVDGGVPGYSLAANGDAAKFTIDAITGDLSFTAAPDFEIATDIGSDNTYNIVVQVSDGIDVTTQAVTVTVLNVDEGPVGPIIDQNPGPNQVIEGAATGSSTGIDVLASDPDTADGVQYSLDPRRGIGC